MTGCHLRAGALPPLHTHTRAPSRAPYTPTTAARALCSRHGRANVRAPRGRLAGRSRRLSSLSAAQCSACCASAPAAARRPRRADTCSAGTASRTGATPRRTAPSAARRWRIGSSGPWPPAPCEHNKDAWCWHQRCTSRAAVTRPRTLGVPPLVCACKACQGRGHHQPFKHWPTN